MTPSPREGRPPRPRVTVVRGTRIVNLPELTIYTHLPKHGLSPELLTQRGANFSDEEVNMPVRRLRTPPVSGRISNTLPGGFLIGRVSPYRYFHEYLVGFDRAVQASDILCPVDLGHPTSFQALQNRPQSKVVVQCWENIPFNWPVDRPLAKHYQAVLEGADHFLPFTKDADRVLRLEGVEDSRRSFVYSGIDLKTFRPPSPTERMEARRRVQAAPGEVVFAFVGRIEFHKGIFSLLEALALARTQVRLDIYGQGKEEALLRKRAERFGLAPRVRFRGRIPHQRLVPDVLWGSDVLAVPSIPTEQWREQLGTIHLEATAAGLPVLASRSGAIPEAIVDGVTGLLPSPDSPEEIAAAIDRLSGDESLRERMGAAGRRRAEELFDCEKNSATLADILWRRVLGRAPPT